MKRVIPLLLALFMLTACGAPAAEPSASPAPTTIPSATPQSTPEVEPEPEPSYEPYVHIEAVVIAGPEESGYTFRSDAQMFSIDIPDAAAPYILITDGREGYIEPGQAVTFEYYSHEYESRLGTFGSVMVIPRSDFFDPMTYYNRSTHSVHSVIKASEDYIYVHFGSIGGTDMTMQPLEGLTAASAAVGYNTLKANIVVDDPDGLPMLERDSLPGAAKTLDAMGEATMTRGEAAKFIFDTLTADNKAKDYPLRFTDVTSGTDEARAIAYLDSYGIFTQYTKDGERIDDGGRFRPDEPITRAEAVQLLQRVQFTRGSRYFDYPLWFYLGGSDCAPASDFDETHWAWDVLNRAWYDGWVELTDGKMRPDEPMTAAEMERAFTALYRELVSYDMELPAVGYGNSMYITDDASDVNAVLVAQGRGEIGRFTCWYSLEVDGKLVCGRVDESEASACKDDVTSKVTVTLPGDLPELTLTSCGNVDWQPSWQSMPYNHEADFTLGYNGPDVRGISSGMSAEEVMARFPADKLYSCSDEGFIYGSEDGAYGKIGSNEYGFRYIEYSDGDSTVRFNLSGTGHVSYAEYSEVQK